VDFLAFLGRFKSFPGDPCFHMLFRDKSFVRDLNICGLKDIFVNVHLNSLMRACFHMLLRDNSFVK
jgi:hypothetical protein